MLRKFAIMLVIMVGSTLLVGCPRTPVATMPAPAPKKEAKNTEAKSDAENNDAEIKTALAKLSPEDRKLAEAQQWCAESEEPLGTMGTPIKITLNDQAVFLCCKGCKKRAEADPTKTLAKVEELKAKHLAAAK